MACLIGNICQLSVIQITQLTSDADEKCCTTTTLCAGTIPVKEIVTRRMRHIEHDGHYSDVPWVLSGPIAPGLAPVVCIGLSPAGPLSFCPEELFMPITSTVATAHLVPIAGPPIPPIELRSKEGGLTLGRHDRCDLCLPADAESISRFHARFTSGNGTWHIADMNSRWGTYLNGVRLEPAQEIVLSEGDLIRLNPWTFSFTRRHHVATGLTLSDDTAHSATMIRSHANATSARLADEMLALLLEAAAGIHAAQDESTLARVLLEEACRGTQLPYAALLRPLDAAGHVEIIAQHAVGAPLDDGAPFSRSLVQAASAGDVVEMTNPADAGISESILANRITSALCVPLMLGQTIAAYLYLDARAEAGAPSARLRPNSAAFCLTLGRMAGLAMSNLKRMDIEKRHALIMADMSAGAEAQRYILPQHSGKAGVWDWYGRSRPGLSLGGDFFDVIDLGDGKLAVALGDVSGKGIAASVLMTASQGFLHAALEQHADPCRAVTDLARFVYPRRPEGKFVTMWVGVFDANTRKLRYIDAGHGYGLLQTAQGGFVPLNKGGGLPVGILDDSDYHLQEVNLPASGRMVVVSDGIIEQFAAGAIAGADQAASQFSILGVKEVCQNAPAGSDMIPTLFDAVVAHAGSTTLNDDATAVVVQW